jgi:uncharacterized protein involved in tolerance to divalent cations
MKIAIIGAGWYGCSIGLELSKDFPQFLIDIYDSENDIFKGAASNNQNRLHHGFHYPRSLETIDEIKNNYAKFVSKYGHLTKKINSNYYLIEKNSKVDFNTYINTYKKFNIPFEIINIQDIKDMINIDLIEGGIRTQEEVIDENAASYYFKNKINHQPNIKLFLNNKINKIDNSNINNVKYDIIINCTYTNPNLGIVSKNKKFNLKYELCIIPVIDNIFKGDSCFTIMDGPFISGYQNSNGDLSLFGVIESPYFKTTSLNKLKKQNLYDKNLINNSVESLLKTAKKYFKNIDQEVNIKHMYISPKVKIKKDTNSIRISKVIMDNNIISVLCGKISSVVSAYDEVKKFISPLV